MDATNNISTDLFYKVRSRFSNLKLGDNSGQITINPEQARFFDFDYVEEDKKIGHVSISLAEPNSMKVYFSNGITEGMDSDQKDGWYGFLRELRKFAKRRLLAFDTRDIAKDNLDKRDYAFLSQYATPESDNDTITKPVGENVMNESNLYGTKTQSFQKLEDTKLIIKHSKKLDDDMDLKPGARSRNISALFVQNESGERFKYPFIHLAGARAMQRHVANSGAPYDEIGESIVKMSEEIAQLKGFTNYCVRNDLMNSDTNRIVERSKVQLDTLRERIAKLSKQSYYEAYIQEFQAPSNPEVDDDVMEQYKEMFTVKNFKEDLTDVFPVIHRLMKEEETVGYDDIVGMTAEAEGTELPEMETEESQDEMAKFEAWVDSLGEESPITTADEEEKADMVKSLNELTGQEFAAGVDGTNAIESLKGIIEDPKLEQDIKKQATEDSNADVRPLLKAWIEENAPDVLDELDFGDMANEPAVGADEVEPQQEEDASMGMNKYGLAAVHKDGKFFSIKDNEITGGPFDSIEELKQHQEELLNNEDTVSEGGNAWDMALTGGMEIISNCDSEEECIKQLEAEITGGKDADDAYADMITKDYIEKIKKHGLEKVKRDVDAEDIMGEPVDLEGQETEGNEFSKKVQDLKSQGAKKGTKFKTSDGEEHTLEGVAKFIHSFYDTNTGTFPKGPEGVCTMVGKKFGEQAEQVARKMVERMAPAQEQGAEELEELERIKQLSGF
jgi:cell pole-organizing protein PopZ